MLICFAALAKAQTQSLIIPRELQLPKDTILRSQLISDLQGFLSQKEQPNNQNKYILKEDLIETSILLDEIKEIEKSIKLKDDHFYKGYLTNVLKLNDSIYKIQFAYIGNNEGTSLIRASFTILAHKKIGHFFFFSPLKYNTRLWKKKTYSSTIVYYKNSLNNSKAKKYFNLINQFDKKLSAPPLSTEFYCCDRYDEVLQLIGVDYKLDYNGRIYGTLTTKEDNDNLVVNGVLTEEFKANDPHDLWHSRLHLVLSIAIINRPVDEGTAYLNGGSWGLSWQEIIRRFKIYVEANPKADWLTLYNESKNFDEKATYPLNVDMMINALIVQKLEQEKGFKAVIELLSCCLFLFWYGNTLYIWIETLQKLSFQKLFRRKI
ncbi:MAG: hypothetical protein HYZ42_04515 [Bacteroidetes bacterium]|nr:hypothetical protein [Bacteroidota bacterium]